jgi:hypothetical protein
MGQNLTKFSSIGTPLLADKDSSLGSVPFRTRRTDMTFMTWV